MADLGPVGLRLLLEAEMLFRVMLAGLFSAALGWERERAGKPAGFRTHIIVGMAAALFVITGIMTVEEQLLSGATVNLDPTRTIHAIAVGIGFLGGGVVFVSRRTDRVEGLTTAASVWATAGVGAATGYGLYLLATGTTVLLLIVLRKLVHLDVSSDAIGDRNGGEPGSGNAAGGGHGGPGRRDE
jgi:putative Mg2+ transporter-C (MgtC) family protein